jgi:hypothetical protein
MPRTEGWLADTQATMLDGMNRGREPELLSDQQAHLLRNLSTRGGRVRSRPRLVKRASMPTGLMQGASVFKTNGKILSAVGGRVYEIDPSTWTRVELTGADSNNPKKPRVWMCETPGSIIIQDNQARPFIYDGVKFRRSDEDEVPVGSVMAFGNGRLAVAVNDGLAVRIGDIRQGEHQSEMKFTETYNLLGGGDFAFESPVRALAVLPVVDTGSGQGLSLIHI